MHDPISGIFVKHSAANLATSALPHAPVVAEQRTRRLSALVTRRRLRRR
jgi:hypothetical protein